MERITIKRACSAKNRHGLRHKPSWPGLTRPFISFEKCFFARMMDRPVKPAYDGLPGNGETLVVPIHFASANLVGVLPVTCRNACENAGTLA
jgi:hypothetical protein